MESSMTFFLRVLYMTWKRGASGRLSMSLAERWHCSNQLPFSSIRYQCWITQPSLFITSQRIFHYVCCREHGDGDYCVELTESFRSSGYLGLCPKEHFHPYCFFLLVQWFCWILFQFRSLFPWEISYKCSLLPPESPSVSFEFYGKHEQLP